MQRSQSGMPVALLSRRDVLRAVGLGAVAGPLAACGGDSSGATPLRFYQSKPEVIGYFDEQVINPFNESQSEINVIHESTGSIVATFVRGSPHDIVCNNYVLEAGLFVSRGVLSDLADVPETERIDPSVQALVDQYATETSGTVVIPYSITAAGVIYNVDLFDQQGVDVPTTWSEFLAVCETFRSAGITPIYSTFKDTWTASQGLFDYVSGSMLDVPGFFEQMKDQGTDVGPDSEVSFEQTFTPAVEKMQALLDYTNDDAGARGYQEGNAAFAAGEAAMYFQGPWGVGEIAKANPDARVANFALPATEDPDDTKCRVNLDLALWIPEQAAQKEAARTFLAYLLTPEVQDKYNLDNLAYSPVTDAPAVQDERIEGLEPYVREGKFYQGAGTYIPPAIPMPNYLQEMVLGGSAETFVRKLDTDWRRLAQRSA